LISILFASKTSVYKTIPGLDVWDCERNALNWPGGNPGIFHPPCRLFSAYLHHFSKAPLSEKHLAHWAVDQVRANGGVLEHPAHSMLWDEAGIPRPGEFPDKHGNFAIEVDQFHWGHPARKRTWLYLCGLDVSVLSFPFRAGLPTHAYCRESPGRLRLSAQLRQGTPISFARWLVELAQRVEDCNGNLRISQQPGS
jgi:hypothetical protein